MYTYIKLFAHRLTMTPTPPPGRVAIVSTHSYHLTARKTHSKLPSTLLWRVAILFTVKYPKQPPTPSPGRVAIVSTNSKHLPHPNTPWRVASASTNGNTSLPPHKHSRQGEKHWYVSIATTNTLRESDNCNVLIVRNTRYPMSNFEALVTIFREQWCHDLQLLCWHTFIYHDVVECFMVQCRYAIEFIMPWMKKVTCHLTVVTFLYFCTFNGSNAYI